MIPIKYLFSFFVNQLWFDSCNSAIFAVNISTSTLDAFSQYGSYFGYQIRYCFPEEGCSAFSLTLYGNVLCSFNTIELLRKFNIGNTKTVISENSQEFSICRILFRVFLSRINSLLFPIIFKTLLVIV